MVRRVALAAALVAAMAAPSIASPLDLFGFGGRSPGLAGTGAASTTDAIYEQDEFFYQANVPSEPALAACLAARD